MNRLGSSLNVHKCKGVMYDEGDWREGCEDCLRRDLSTNEANGPWITPPTVIVFECECRIPSYLENAMREEKASPIGTFNAWAKNHSLESLDACGLLSPNK